MDSLGDRRKFTLSLTRSEHPRTNPLRPSSSSHSREQHLLLSFEYSSLYYWQPSADLYIFLLLFVFYIYTFNRDIDNFWLQPPLPRSLVRNLNSDRGRAKDSSGRRPRRRARAPPRASFTSIPRIVSARSFFTGAFYTVDEFFCAITGSGNARTPSVYTGDMPARHLLSARKLPPMLLHLTCSERTPYSSRSVIIKPGTVYSASSRGARKTIEKTQSTDILGSQWSEGCILQYRVQ